MLLEHHVWEALFLSPYDEHNIVTIVGHVVVTLDILEQNDVKYYLVRKPNLSGFIN